MLQYLPLQNNLAEAMRWRSLSPAETRRRQVLRFSRLFEHARTHSPFCRRLCTEAGIEKLVIRNMEYIERVPLVDKAMLRAAPTEDCMTLRSPVALWKR